MPDKTKPVSNSFRRIEEYSSLKQFELDAKAFKAQLYTHWRRSPRVGRPAEQAERVQVEATINALMPAFTRLQRWRARRPDRHYPPISQGRLRKLVTRRLKQENVKVPADNKTVRDACKMLRLVRGSKTMRDYTLQEWAWLVKHSKPADREKARILVASFIETSAMNLKEVKGLKFGSPRVRKLIATVQKWEISHYTKRLARYERVLTLFPSRP